MIDAGPPDGKAEGAALDTHVVAIERAKEEALLQHAAEEGMPGSSFAVGGAEQPAFIGTTVSAMERLLLVVGDLDRGDADGFLELPELGAQTL